MSNFKEILSHGRNYIFANLATKGLAFISIPFYTHTLTEHEYGIVSIYLGVVGIYSVLVCLSVDRSVSRYYFDRQGEEDYRQFIGTSSILSFAIYTLTSFIVLLYAEEFGNFVGLGKTVVYLILPISLIEVVGLFFEQIYGPLKQSKKIAISSLIRVYGGFVISMVIILALDHERYFGAFYGQIIMGSFMIVYWLRNIRPYYSSFISYAHIKYILKYSVPLIPYALSGTIIAQFGKISLGRTENIGEAGFYNIAVAVSSIVLMVVGVTHQAWNPYYMEYMNSKSYNNVDKDFARILKITVIVAVFVGAFGIEIGNIIAKSEFTSSLYLIPILVYGYILFQISGIYLRGFGYFKKTQYMTITVFVAGLSNILMNIFLDKHFAELGVAISFSISYGIMVVTGYVLNKYYVRAHTPPIKQLGFPMMVASIALPLIFMTQYYDNYLLALVIKLGVVTGSSIILLWGEKMILMETLHSWLGD